MVIADGFVYYGSVAGGIDKARSPSRAKRRYPGATTAPSISLAVGPDDLWYSEGPCIFRTAK
jgi:hypothetical protein